MDLDVSYSDSQSELLTPQTQSRFSQYSKLLEQRMEETKKSIDETILEVGESTRRMEEERQRFEENFTMSEASHSSRILSVREQLDREQQLRKEAEKAMKEAQKREAAQEMAKLVIKKKLDMVEEKAHELKSHAKKVDEELIRVNRKLDTERSHRLAPLRDPDAPAFNITEDALAHLRGNVEPETMDRLEDLLLIQQEEFKKALSKVEGELLEERAAHKNTQAQLIMMEQKCSDQRRIISTEVNNLKRYHKQAMFLKEML